MSDGGTWLGKGSKVEVSYLLAKPGNVFDQKQLRGYLFISKSARICYCVFHHRYVYILSRYHPCDLSTSHLLAFNFDRGRGTLCVHSLSTAVTGG